MKYRLYDKQRKKMIYPDNEAEQYYNVEIYMDDSFSVERKYKKEGMGYRWWVEKSKDFVLMRSTGLKDTGGNQIYEDDIVKAGAKEEVVKYREELGAFALGKTSTLLWEINCYVIGNIHKNQKTLEE